MFPYGNMTMTIITTPDLGQFVRATRKALGVTQDQLALTSGTNRRFIVEIESGKATAQIGKVLQVLKTLGVTITLASPPGANALNTKPPAPQPRHATKT